jgi:hypothetical protein
MNLDNLWKFIGTIREMKTPCKPYRRLLEEVVRFKSETETDNPTRRPE